MTDNVNNVVDLGTFKRTRLLRAPEVSIDGGAGKHPVPAVIPHVDDEVGQVVER